MESLLFNTTVILPASLTTVGSQIFGDIYQRCIYSSCGTDDGQTLTIKYAGTSIPAGFSTDSDSCPNSSWNTYGSDSSGCSADYFKTYISNGSGGWIQQ